MSYRRFIPLVILLVAIFFLTGCGREQMIPTLVATTPTFTPMPLQSITSSPTFSTPSPTISKTKTKRPTPPNTPTETANLTPTFDSLSSIRPGAYIMINVFTTDPERDETALFTMDGTYQAHLAEEGGPVAPGAEKMVVWDSASSLHTVSCSGIRILDLESHVVTKNSLPIGYQGCEFLNWSLDGKKLFFIGDSRNIVEYDLITQQSVVLLDSSAYDYSEGFDELHLSPDGKWLAFYWWVGELGKKNLGGLYILNLACSAEPSNCIKQAYLLLGTNWNSALAWTPDGYLTRFEDQTIQIYDTSKKTIINTIWIDSGINIFKFAWSPDKKMIIVCDQYPGNIGGFGASGGKFTIWKGLKGSVLGWLVIPSPTSAP